jgi:hypothetical protein
LGRLCTNWRTPGKTAPNSLFVNPGSHRIARDPSRRE